MCEFGFFLQNVKEHAAVSAEVSFDHGVEVGATDEYVNRSADRDCVSRLVRILGFIWWNVRV